MYSSWFWLQIFCSLMLVRSGGGSSYSDRSSGIHGSLPCDLIIIHSTKQCSVAMSLPLLWTERKNEKPERE
jgi:hypothetical protein